MSESRGDYVSANCTGFGSCFCSRAGRGVSYNGILCSASTSICVSVSFLIAVSRGVAVGGSSNHEVCFVDLSLCFGEVFTATAMVVSRLACFKLGSGMDGINLSYESSVCVIVCVNRAVALTTRADRLRYASSSSATMLGLILYAIRLVGAVGSCTLFPMVVCILAVEGVAVGMEMRCGCNCKRLTITVIHHCCTVKL